MSRTVGDTPGGSAGRRSPRVRGRRWAAAAAAVAIAIVSACGPTPTPRTPTFALSIRNASDAAVRLKVLIVSEGLPDGDLLIPARSGILSTPARDMDISGSSPEPVVVEIYTDTCARLTSVTIGEGRTRIVINADLSVTTAAEPGDPGAGAVEPGLVPAC